MATTGKKINELTAISTVSDETVLPAVYVDGSTTASTATKVSISQISSKIQEDMSTILDGKQDKLSSANAGTNVTITEEGGIVKINATDTGVTSYNDLTDKPAIDGNTLTSSSTASGLGLATSTDLSGKQDTLVSGTNIKTINDASILGSGNISVQPVTSIVTLTTSSTQLATNTIYNGGTLASVTLTLPSTIPLDFLCQVEFSSGSTATTFTAPSSLYFMGDATNGSGVFTPIANKRYCIMILTNGSTVLGLVIEK